MTPGRTPNWNMLAPVWHCFEQFGSTYSTVRSVLGELRPPVLYVGGGRGVFPTRLARYLGPGSVITIDSSIAMTRRARSEFDLQCLQADARAIPLGHAVAGSAYCATGVLEYLNRADRVQALRELARVVRPGGCIVLAGGADRGSAAHLAAELIAWRDGYINHLRAFDAVAHVVGGRTAAYELLAAALPESLGEASPLGLDELVDAGLESLGSVGQEPGSLVVSRSR